MHRYGYGGSSVTTKSLLAMVICSSLSVPATAQDCATGSSEHFWMIHSKQWDHLLKINNSCRCDISVNAWAVGFETSGITFNVDKGATSRNHTVTIKPQKHDIKFSFRCVR